MNEDNPFDKPAGAQKFINTRWYKVNERGLVMGWDSEFQEWVNSTMKFTPIVGDVCKHDQAVRPLDLALEDVLAEGRWMCIYEIHSLAKGQIEFNATMQQVRISLRRLLCLAKVKRKKLGKKLVWHLKQ